MLSIIGVISLVITNSALSYKIMEYTTINVSEGDTLWGIAKDLQVNNNQYKEKDVRYIMEDLIEINKLDSKELKVNQQLQIPKG